MNDHGRESLLDLTPLPPPGTPRRRLEKLARDAEDAARIWRDLGRVFQAAKFDAKRVALLAMLAATPK